MTTFVVLAALMVLIALAAILWPLARAKSSAGKRWPGIAIAGVAVPAIAVTLYLALTNFEWNPSNVPGAVPPEIERMVSGLEARLKNNPSDVPGWLMLGRSYFQLDRYFKAADAYQQAYTLTQGKDVEAVVGLGEALAFADESMLMSRSAELFEQAHAMAPDNPKVLWYSGLIAYQGGRLALARDRWASLVALNPPPEIKQILQAKVAQIEAQLGQAAGAAAQTPESPSAGSTAGGSPAVKVRVAVSPELAGRVPPDAPLFVLVRAGEGGGPPLAVTKRAASQLPALVELTDRDAMISGRGLGDVGLVTVIARIARSGEPVARSGDLEGRVSYDLARSAPVDLVINSIVP
jgi:cytochrome c-type biogenesis protein CcmH